MNPLNRRMFRQPGMSRQPAGILASSPQLANTVANRQPVRMANGGTNTYTAAVQKAVQAGDKRALQELAKPVNYGAAARTPDGQNALRLARQAIAQSTQISTGTAVDAPVSDAERMAANRANLGSLRGQVGQDALTDQAMAQINAANRPSESPVTFAERGIQGPPNVDAMGNVNTSTDDAMQAAMQANVDTSGPSLIDRGIAAARDVGKNIASAVTVSPSQIEDPSKLRTRANVGDRLSSILDYRGALRPDEEILDFEINTGKSSVNLDDVETTNRAEEAIAFGDEFGNIAPDGTMPGETLVASTTTTTPTTTDDSKKTEVVTPSETDIAIQKVSDNALNFKGDVFNQKDKKKLTAKEATNQSVLENFSYETADFISPEEVDLKAIDKAAEDLMGFDPKAAGEKRENAFWMGLMKAGLAIAAGGSENAITNIAKGLSFGLDSYGKDIATLNEQEREDRKEFRRLKVKMIDDKRAYNLSMAGAMNTHNQHIADARNKFNMNRRTLGLQEAQNKLAADRLIADNAYRVAVMENTAIVDAAKLRQKDKEIELSEKTLQATIDKLTPKNLRTFQELGLVKDGEFTDKALELYTTEANAIRALLNTGTGNLTDKDKDAASIKEQYGLTDAQARIVAATQSALLKDYGTFESAIKALGFDKPAAPQKVVVDPSQLKSK